mmetsp:Transcript_24548/g.40687  ORF Transcript_24548/g.40687 Transcript_24548/m.40687 type:complete len:102 (+) Transcript_24548:560-865(+)
MVMHWPTFLTPADQAPSEASMDRAKCIPIKVLCLVEEYMRAASGGSMCCTGGSGNAGGVEGEGSKGEGSKGEGCNGEGCNGGKGGTGGNEGNSNGGAETLI